MLVRRVACGLTAELLVALDGAHVRDLDHDRLAERAGVTRRVGVFVSGQGKAAAARVACTKSWNRAERELVDGGGVAACRFTAGYVGAI